MKEPPWILVVDDDPAILELVQDLLSSLYFVDTVDNVKKAQTRLRTRPYDLVLTDMVMPEIGGMEMVKYVKLHHPETPIIVFTGFANFQDAVTAVKLGAFDYLPKPIQTDILKHSIGRALEYRRLSRMQRDLEVVLQGAEALGWQALDLLSDTPEATVMASLREVGLSGASLQEVGQQFLSGALKLVGATRSSIFLYDENAGLFKGLAALGTEAQSRNREAVPVNEGIMGQVLTQRRPLLVADIDLDQRFSVSSRRFSYRTTSFMIVPLMGAKFWGVVNLTDRDDEQPFAARDLFLSWLLGRLFVEVLESREPTPALEPQPLMSSLAQDHLPLGLALLNEEHKVIRANSALERLLGFRGQNLMGEKLLKHMGLADNDKEMVEKSFRQVLKDQEPREFSQLKSTVDGKVRFLGLKVVPSLSREAPNALVLVEDMSELENLRQRLHLYEHLAIMGKLSLCVAHELNNPLDGIRRYLSLAQLKKTDPGEVDRYLTEAQKGLQKMSLTIRSLLSSANPLKAPRATDNLWNLLQDAVKIMMFQASDQRVQVTFHPSAEFKQVLVEGDLYHVFINLIKNALQAMSQGGSLKINGSQNAREIVVSFQDTGPGLSNQELSQIFQPFYSTKEGTQSLGLGLPICRKILERYGGQLTVASQPGQGTTVIVVLPKSGSGANLGT